MEPLTLERAVELAEEVVKEAGPGYRTKLCWYVVDNQPCCLVGRILYKHGYTVEELSSFGSTVITNLIIGFRIKATGKATNFLEKLQRRQDAGYVWRDILTHVRDNMKVKVDGQS